MDKYTLDTGTLSIAWLKADIMTVYKKDDNHLAENYRPIWLALVVSNLGRIIFRNLNHLEENSTLTCLNHCFQSGYSCETPLLLASNALLKAYDKGTGLMLGYYISLRHSLLCNTRRCSISSINTASKALSMPGWPAFWHAAIWEWCWTALNRRKSQSSRVFHSGPYLVPYCFCAT